jgi:hypothetical protein
MASWRKCEYRRFIECAEEPRLRADFDGGFAPNAKSDGLLAVYGGIDAQPDEEPMPQRSGSIG